MFVFTGKLDGYLGECIRVPTVAVENYSCWFSLLDRRLQADTSLFTIIFDYPTFEFHKVFLKESLQSYLSAINFSLGWFSESHSWRLFRFQIKYSDPLLATFLMYIFNTDLPIRKSKFLKTNENDFFFVICSFNIYFI